MANREFTIAGEHRYNRKGPRRWVVSHTVRYPVALIVFVVGTALANVCVAAVPVLIGAAFNVVLQPAADRGTLLALALGILALGAGQFAFGGAGVWGSEFLAQRMERDARDELYVSLLGKSQTFHNRQRVGDIMARANNDVRQLNAMMNPGVSLILSDSTLGLVVPIVFIAALDPQLLLAPLAFTVAFVIALRRYTRRLAPVSWQMRQQFGDMNAGLAETVTGIEVVKSAAQEPQEERKFAHNAALYRDSFVRNGHIQARYVPPLLLAVAIVGAFLHGVLLVSRGELSIGALVTYIGLMNLLFTPAFISIFSFNLVQLGFAGARRILSLMAEETELDENRGGPSGYYPRRNRLRPRQLRLRRDAHPRGRLVPRRAGADRRHRRPDRRWQEHADQARQSHVRRHRRTHPDRRRGRARLEPRVAPLADLDHRAGRLPLLALHRREHRLQPGAACRARRDSSRRRKRRRRTSSSPSFKEGYETIIGERGVTLSGGQRQRLAIARALLTDPRILILDDSTSAIDSATEDEIQRAIRRVLEGRTTLLITHRLSQIRWADKILVLRQGRAGRPGHARGAAGALRPLPPHLRSLRRVGTRGRGDCRGGGGIVTWAS